MLLITLALATALNAQQPAEPAKPEVAALKANLGACSADFVVKYADGKAISEKAPLAR